jgi:phosphoribosylglycinamide formyltransferase-1
MNVAIFASGGGSNFQTLLDRVSSGDLHCNLALCVGNNSKAFAFERARTSSIPVCHIAPSHFTTIDLYEKALLSVLEKNGIELIVLAGYMKQIPASLIRAYPNRIINIHPGLLPAFGGKGLYGEKVHQAVLDYGAKISGITIHYVDEEYDHGPIIFQACAPVLDEDDARSLAARVLLLEHENYWKVIEAIVNGRITVNGKRAYGEV